MKIARGSGDSLAGDSGRGFFCRNLGPERGAFMIARPTGRAGWSKGAGITGLADVTQLGAAIEKMAVPVRGRYSASIAVFHSRWTNPWRGFREPSLKEPFRNCAGRKMSDFIGFSF